MSGWYPSCGLHYELETQCTTQLIEHLDKKCAGQFDKGLASVQQEAASQGMDRVISQISEGSKQFPALRAMGKCVQTQGPHMPPFNEESAQTKFAQSSRLFGL
eukprot:GEMP01048005.1.p3 GENE.GEMP01048005.1~~GEMP01048005.1.p3  ORF type:complete len:103 (+),score=14.67 GEMP01048005.1:410-718(+)